MVIRVNSVKRMKVKMVVMIFDCCFPLSCAHKPWKASYFNCCFLTVSSLSGWWCNRCVIFQLLKYCLLSQSVRILIWPFTPTMKILLLFTHICVVPNPYSVIIFGLKTFFQEMFCNTCHAETIWSDLWLSSSKKGQKNPYQK